jgi:hypothetical protein
MTPTIRQRTRFHGAGVAVPGDNAAVRTGQLPPGTRVISLPREDAAPLAELSAHDRGDVVVAGLRGELDLLGAAVVRAHLSNIRHGHAAISQLSCHPHWLPPARWAGDTRASFAGDFGGFYVTRISRGDRPRP